MANTIDKLVIDDPLNLSDADIDAIIAYQRAQRANKEANPTKARAKKEQGPKIKLDLVEMGLMKPAEPFKRRF